MKKESKKISFEDSRGRIIDILTGEIIDSVTIISSRAGAVRGNHYHKESVQYTYVLKGRLKFYAQMPEGKIETTTLKAGDLVYTSPLERHAMVAEEDSEFLVLTRGPRSGQNYEKDTYRLSRSLVS